MVFFKGKIEPIEGRESERLLWHKPMFSHRGINTNHETFLKSQTASDGVILHSSKKKSVQ